MTFPTDHDLAFFASEQAKPIQPLIRCCVGDYYYNKAYQPSLRMKLFAGQQLMPGDIKIPRPDQLSDMLEERGCFWRVTQVEPNWYYAWAIPADPYEKPKQQRTSEGPTPAIALAKALLAVMEKER